MQRLHAIVSYIETAFSTEDGRYFDIQHFPTAKRRSDEGVFVIAEAKSLLSQRDVSIVLDYTISLSVMRNAKEEEINDVFSRINTYGHRLSEQERRQAGVQNEFSNLVRKMACSLRGDATSEILPLHSMPSISIDLPKTKHGYDVQAEDVFWVKHGILRSTDLRDSMDEQCIADITASIISGEIIERAKDALDEIYTIGSVSAKRISSSLDVYSVEKISDELIYCINEIITVCNAGKFTKLRDIIFQKQTSNAFPSTFAIIVIAFHELIIREQMKIADYDSLKSAINNLASRVERGQKATSPEERRTNVNAVKGLISPSFVKAEANRRIYSNHSVIDIETLIRRSEIELSNFEFKQGCLMLEDKRKLDRTIFDKVIKTICGIANNGKEQNGTIIIGIADKAADAERIAKLDDLEPRKIGRKYAVGVVREAVHLKISIEGYYNKWKDAIENSGISQPLKNDVLSHIDYNSYYGMGLIVISIPAQKEISYVDGDVYWRSGSSTAKAVKAADIASVAKRF